MRLTFIGGGNMASALIGGLIARGQRAADVSVIDPAADCRVGLAQRLGVRVAERPDAAAAPATPTSGERSTSSGTGSARSTDAPSSA